MDFLEQYRTWLEQKGIAFEESGAEDREVICVAARSQEGFEVRLEHPSHSEPWSLQRESWHEMLDGDDEDNLALVQDALMGRIRIRVCICGANPHRWTAERLRDGDWVPFGETGLLFFRFWLKRSERVLMNASWGG